MSNTSALGLCMGSFVKQILTKSQNSLDHLEGRSRKGGSDLKSFLNSFNEKSVEKNIFKYLGWRTNYFWILSNTRIGDISWYGGSIWANSTKVIPKTGKRRKIINLVVLLFDPALSLVFRAQLVLYFWGIFLT